MQDRRTHGILTEKPPAQTYCGLSAFNRRVTHDPFKVDCEECIPVMEMMGTLPDLKKPVEKRKRGRPKRSMFGI